MNFQNDDLRNTLKIIDTLKISIAAIKADIELLKLSQVKLDSNVFSTIDNILTIKAWPGLIDLSNKTEELRIYQTILVGEIDKLRKTIPIITFPQ
jgi:hypothetical protein